MTNDNNNARSNPDRGSRGPRQTKSGGWDEESGGPDLLPESLRGLPVHQEEMVSVTKIEYTGPHTRDTVRKWAIKFSGGNMPVGYWHTVGDKWEIVDCKARVEGGGVRLQILVEERDD